jgi:hypothetical protein
VQYFANKPELANQLKGAALLFLAGVICFAVAFLILTLLPLAILRFVEASDKTYKSFSELMKEFAKSNKSDAAFYSVLIWISLLSFSLFIMGCILALGVVLGF